MAVATVSVRAAGERRVAQTGDAVGRQVAQTGDAVGRQVAHGRRPRGRESGDGSDGGDARPSP